MTVYVVTDLNMSHYLAETCSLNALHVQCNTALSLTELSFLIEVIRKTGFVMRQYVIRGRADIGIVQIPNSEMHFRDSNLHN